VWRLQTPARKPDGCCQLREGSTQPPCQARWHGAV